MLMALMHMHFACHSRSAPTLISHIADPGHAVSVVGSWCYARLRRDASCRTGSDWLKHVPEAIIRVWTLLQDHLWHRVRTCCDSDRISWQLGDTARSGSLWAHARPGKPVVRSSRVHRQAIVSQFGGV